MIKRIRITSALTVIVLFGLVPMAQAVVGADRPVRSDEAKWTASVMNWSEAAGLTSFCSGTLIAPRLVLTAAHCVMWADDAETWKVNIGQSSQKAFDGQLINVIGAIYNESYETQQSYDIINPTTGDVIESVEGIVPPGGSQFDSDIALLLLESPVIGITPAKMANTSSKITPNWRVYGWGAEETFSFSGSNELLTTSVDDATEEMGYLIDDPMNRMLAAYRVNDDGSVHNTCFGDSGGPLVDGKGLLIGITSFSIVENCGEATPTVYTKVSSFRTWIFRASSRLIGLSLRKLPNELTKEQISTKDKLGNPVYHPVLVNSLP